MGWSGGGEGGREGGFLVASLLLLDAGQLVVVLLRDKVGVVVEDGSGVATYSGYCNVLGRTNRNTNTDH